MPVSISLRKPTPNKSRKRVFYKRAGQTKTQLKPRRSRATKSLFKHAPSPADSSAPPRFSQPKSKPKPDLISPLRQEPKAFDLFSSPPNNSPFSDLTDLSPPDDLSTPILPEEKEDPAVVDNASYSPGQLKTSTQSLQDSSDQITQLKQLIETTAAKLAQLEEEKAKKANPIAPSITSPQEFNGVDSPDEASELLELQIKKLQRQNEQLKHQLNLLKKEFSQEKAQLENTIKELRAELHRSAPIQDNKFFSLSKELHQAVQAIEKLADDSTIDSDETSSDSPLPSSVSNPIQPSPSPQSASQEPITKSIQVTSERKKKPLSKEVKLAAIGLATVSVVGLGGVISYQISSQPKVDEQLVQEYISQTGQVKGSQSATEQKSRQPQGDKYREQPFEETKWETYQDSMLNVSVAYPYELVERLQTANSITFLRKDGFIFKIQTYKSQDTLEEFWEKQKDTGLKYIAKPIDFIGDAPAYHLQLDDTTEYPGDRYLIKHNDQIFDIWFATESDKFSPDDIKRAKKMLDSFTWLD